MFAVERIALPLGLAVSATVCVSSLANAEVVQTNAAATAPQAASGSVFQTFKSSIAADRLARLVEPTASTAAAATPVADAAAPVATQAAQPVALQPSSATAASSVETSDSAATEPASPASAQSSQIPVPGTVATKATGLSDQPSTEPSVQAPTKNTSQVVAQDITPGTATRSGSSYIGVGGNIGIVDGSTDVGQGAFAVISKIGLTPLISVRPSVLIGDNVTVLIPVTYDFSTAATVGEFGISPFIGLGLAIATDADDALNGLATAGVDVPITSQFTATGSVNVTFGNETDLGILLGVGYNFSGF